MSNKTPDSCRIVRLDVEELDRSVADPVLASLLADGWAPISNLVVEERGKNVLVFVLRPPLVQRTEIVSAPMRLLLLAALLSALSGAIVGTLLLLGAS